MWRLKAWTFPIVFLASLWLCGGEATAQPFGGGAGQSGRVQVNAGGASLGLTFGQGSSRSISSSAASVTGIPGYPSSFQSQVWRPFVVGVTPVVGDFPQIIDGGRVAGSVGQQQLSRVRQSQATLQNRKLEQYLRRAESAAAEGNKRMARANFRSAIAISAEPLRSQLRRRLIEVMKAE